MGEPEAQGKTWASRALGCSLLGSSVLLLFVAGCTAWWLAPSAGWVPDGLKRRVVSGRLRRRNLPPLPAAARDIKAYKAPLIGAFLYARFDAEAQDAEAFLEELPNAEGLTIGEGEGEVRLITPEELYGLESRPDYDYVEVMVVNPRFPWFTPHKIRRGRLYRWSKKAKPLGYQVYYDEGSGTVFIYWLRT